MRQMIDEDKARQIAQAALEAEQGSQILRLHGAAIERPGHWAFPFNTAAYYETGDAMLGVVGSGPIAVSKLDGSVRWLSSALPLDEQI